MNRLKKTDFLYLTLGVMGIIIGLALFYSGSHNVDLSFNVLRFICDFFDEDPNDYCDIGTNGKCDSYPHIYISGIKQIRYGFSIFGIGLYLFGIFIGKTLNLKI